MYICDKQCEIMQNIQWKGSDEQLQWFYKVTSGDMHWKRKEEKTRTRETKTCITQNFELVWPNTGRTVWKSAPSAFRIWMTQGCLDDFSHSYLPFKVKSNFRSPTRPHPPILNYDSLTKKALWRQWSKMMRIGYLALERATMRFMESQFYLDIAIL